MRWLLSLILVLLTVGTLRVVGCGDESPCGDCNDGNPCTRDVCDSYNTSGTISCDPEDISYRCEHSPLSGPSCSGGVCMAGVCVEYDGTIPCTEQGIRLAVVLGGGPHTLECNGPTTVVTQAQIEIDNDVILDGEGNLTVDASGGGHRVFSVAAGITAELRGMTVMGGDGSSHQPGSGILNKGTLTLINSTVSGNTSQWGSPGGIYNVEGGSLTLENSNVSGNTTSGIINEGTLTLINSTVSGNGTDYVGGIYNSGTLTLINGTVSGNSAESGTGGIDNLPSGSVSLLASIVADNYRDGGTSNCRGHISSNGYNIESPGNTCGFDPDGTDQVNVTEGELNLGTLQDNDGPTETHALLPGSVAIDQIPAADCEVTEDQRDEPRPETGGDACDVGSFERQPTDSN